MDVFYDGGGGVSNINLPPPPSKFRNYAETALSPRQAFENKAVSGIVPEF